MLCLLLFYPGAGYDPAQRLSLRTWALLNCLNDLVAIFMQQPTLPYVPICTQLCCRSAAAAEACQGGRVQQLQDRAQAGRWKQVEGCGRLLHMQAVLLESFQHKRKERHGLAKGCQLEQQDTNGK
jgi:hypothetical protein